MLLPLHCEQVFRLAEFRELNEFKENVSAFHEKCYVKRKRGYVKKIRLLIYIYM